MYRQISEAELIQKAGKEGTVLNRRGEWGQNLPPRMMIEDHKLPPIVQGQVPPPHPAPKSKKITKIDTLNVDQLEAEVKSSRGEKRKKEGEGYSPPKMVKKT